MTTAKPVLPSFAAGEVSPQLFGRVDLQKYQTGLETAENLIILPSGGATSRPGTRFVATVRDPAKKARLIPFRFSTTQAYILEFGDGYTRVYKDGAQMTYATKTISGATTANPVVITSNAHGFTNGMCVTIAGVTTMKELNNREFTVAGADANTFQLKENGVNVNGTAYTAFGANPTGTVARIVEVMEIAKPITGVTKANPAVVTSVDHGYYTGQRVFISGVGGMTQLNGSWFTVGGTDTNTFELQGITSVGFSTYTSGGTVQREGTPFLQGHIADLSTAQSADVLYMAHTAHKQRKLTRSSHTDWLLSEVKFSGGPLQVMNLDENKGTVRLSGNSGSNLTLTASASNFFTSADVGTLFCLQIQDQSLILPWEPSQPHFNVGIYCIYAGRIYRCSRSAESWTGTVPPTHESGFAWDGSVQRREWEFISFTYGVVRITAVTDDKHAKVEVLKNAQGEEMKPPQQVVDSATWRWARGEWSSTRGYPGALSFHEQRLLWAGSPSAPQTIWGSKTSDYENHTAGDKDDDALIYTVASNEMNFIKWLRSMKSLVFGSASGEFVAAGSESGAPLTPSSVRIMPGTSEGSGTCQSARVGSSVLFANAGQRRLHELVYSFEQDAFVAPDRMLFSDHLTSPTSRLKEIAWQQEPNRTLWACTTDGILLSLTYRPDHEVFAWSCHPRAGAVESLAVIPTQDGTSSEVWMVVRYGPDDNTAKRTIEVMTQPHEPVDESDKAACVLVDSSLELNIAEEEDPRSVVTGLWHLNGKEVAILAEGAVHPSRTVANGAITLEYPVRRAQVGLGYTQKLKTLRLEIAALGTVQGRKRRIPEIKVRFRNTLGGKVGVAEDKLQTIPTLGTGMLGQSPPLFTGLKRIACDSTFEDDGGQIVIVQDQPLPMTILSIIPTVSVTEG